MTISDETLMAFSDGELSGEERAAVERAIQENPELEKRVARHRALRDRIKLAYSADLSEAVPDRLLAAARDESRTAGDESSYKPGWRSLGGIAAGILLGLGVGYGLWQQGGPIGRSAEGVLIATGSLKSALTAQLAAEQAPAARVRIGISFRDKSGEYCRSFALSGAANPVGIACHHGVDWQIQTLMKGQA